MFTVESGREQTGGGGKRRSSHELLSTLTEGGGQGDRRGEPRGTEVRGRVGLFQIRNGTG